jgi:hypothetical protein
MRFQALSNMFVNKRLMPTVCLISFEMLDLREPISTARLYQNAATRRHKMSIFGSIMEKIFHSSAPGTSTSGGATPTTASVSNAPTPPPPGSVDVGQILTQMASQKGGGGNWQTSIVDLLKLLDLDSSLGARKELGNELNVHAGADGSAEQNIALHAAVMQKLAENGGKVPDSLRGHG